MLRRSLAAVAIVGCWLCGPAAAQTGREAAQRGLASLVPEDAIFHLERKGFHAVREAFRASNLGELASDEAMKAFVHDSCDRIGDLIAKSLWDLREPQEIRRRRRTLGRLLKPFWYNPCAVFLIAGKKLADPPGAGFICRTGDYKAACENALKELMAMGLPERPGQEGTRQQFVYRKGAAVWQGVVKQSEPFKLPAGEAKRNEYLRQRANKIFMISWLSDVLFVASDLRAADAMSRMLSITRPAKGKDTNPHYRTVMRKAAMTDWAFRWYLDVARLRKLAGSDLPKELTALDLDELKGVGGTAGYVDNVYARKTYLLAPEAAKGPVRYLKKGGSYRKALAMVPDTSTMLVAVQVDKDMPVQTIRDMLDMRFPAAPGAGRDANSPHEKAFVQIKRLAAASGGNVAFMMSSIEGLVGVLAGGGPPLATVMDIEDRASAEQAIEALLKMADRPDAEKLKLLPKVYRKVPLRYFGSSHAPSRLALMDDRVILAMSEGALKAAVDAALDDTGGFAPDSKAGKYAKLCGDGAGVFMMDLASLIKTIWPLVMQFSVSAGDDFPLASMPSAGKMRRLLGPELSVFSTDAEGVLLNSRGLVPFSTKTVFLYPLMGVAFWMAF
jgi:hypothetical protein